LLIVMWALAVQARPRSVRGVRVKVVLNCILNVIRLVVSVGFWDILGSLLSEKEGISKVVESRNLCNKRLKTFSGAISS
jgi:hypothetical protein